jgi:hypothetical protein
MGVARLGCEPPEIDLELREGIESSELVFPDVVVPQVSRDAREVICGEGCEDA